MRTEMSISNIVSSAIVMVVTVSVVILSTNAFALKPKTYQVTGPVIDLTDSTITVEKAKGERWVIARDAITRTSGGELKIGDRVTVSYIMAADNIVVKPGKADRASFVEAGKAAAADAEKAPAKINSNSTDENQNNQ